ncbi:hypothetical protein [Glaciibacter flavus]|uniref:hypothetical protein n=1 Tax=Orlajensenia flava TaxID=2565934 RepID=UPI003AFFFD1A
MSCSISGRTTIEVIVSRAGSSAARGTSDEVGEPVGFADLEASAVGGGDGAAQPASRAAKASADAVAVATDLFDISLLI